MPTKKVHITPRDFFMNLLVFAALYASVVSFLALIFAYINVLFPDKLGYFRSYGNYAAEIITPSSVLMVIFPVFILISWLLRKDLTKSPEKKELKFRKWLVYLTLFAAVVTIMVDLITLISSFYHGELTSRFVFKVLGVLLVAAGVFWYYFLDLRESSALKPKLSAWISSLIVLATLVAGFFVVGTPSQQRARRFDETRINNLQLIQNQLLNYWIQKEKLPEQINELTKDQLSGFALPVDPETGINYGYHKLTAFSFDLCADFKTDSKNYPEFPGENPPYPTPVLLRFSKDHPSNTWTHGKGETCFERTIDPELYKKPNV